jgi:hypothetical protein
MTHRTATKPRSATSTGLARRTSSGGRISNICPLIVGDFVFGQHWPTFHKQFWVDPNSMPVRDPGFGSDFKIWICLNGLRSGARISFSQVKQSGVVLQILSFDLNICSSFRKVPYKSSFVLKTFSKVLGLVRKKPR